MTTVGTGKYTYTLIEDWAKPPPGESFAMVSAVAVDSQDRVYAFQRKDPPVAVFDRDGNFLSSWGNGAFLFPHGISITDDIVYLTDRDSSVCIVYTLDGKPIQMLGRHGVHSDTGCERPGDLVPRAAGPFNYPSELVVAPSGDLYVSDGYRNARVHRFSGDGQLKASWGEPGTDAPNQFHLPHSLVVDDGERVYVCDRENHRIQVFTTAGEYVTMWTDIQRPMDISLDTDGVIHVSEAGVDGSSARISVLDKQGKVLARFECRGPGHGSWVDSHGDIYVGLGDPGGVDKYVRQG
jgi:DNA-binding beta-propeller fold protein YncE